MDFAECMERQGAPLPRDVPLSPKSKACVLPHSAHVAWKIKTNTLRHAELPYAIDEREPIIRVEVEAEVRRLTPVHDRCES